MPNNTIQLGTNRWQRFVFTGTTPITNAELSLSPVSRIEIAVAGAANVESEKPLFRIQQSEKDTIRVNHLTFDKFLSSGAFMLTQFRIADISENIPAILDQQEDRFLISGGLVWTRSYVDNSKDLIVYNPLQQTDTVEGIRSNAKVWLLHADNTGNWTIGNLYGTNSAPTFPGFTVTPVVNTFGTSLTGVQHEIVF